MVKFLDKEEELQVMRRMSDVNFSGEVRQMLTKDEIFAIRDAINQIQISESLEKYIIELVFATRKPADYGLTQEANFIQ